jgi:hypothetical protein
MAERNAAIADLLKQLNRRAGDAPVRATSPSSSAARHWMSVSFPRQAARSPA